MTGTTLAPQGQLFVPVRIEPDLVARLQVLVPEQVEPILLAQVQLLLRAEEQTHLVYSVHQVPQSGKMIEMRATDLERPVLAPVVVAEQ